MDIDFADRAAARRPAPAPGGDDEPPRAGSSSTAADAAPAGDAPSTSAHRDGGGPSTSSDHGGGDDDAVTAAPHGGPAVPPHLARLLASLPSDENAAAAAVTGHGLLVLAAHAAMLETGFVPADEADSGASSSGSSGAGGAYDAPALLAAGAGGVHALRYRLACCSGEGGGKGAAGSPSVMVRCLEVGPHLVAAGIVATEGGGGGQQQQQQQPKEQLESLTLSVAEFCTPAAAAAAAAGDAAAPSGSGDAIAAAPVAPRRRGWPHAARLAARLPDLWIALRDRLALPLLARAAAAAGLPPPAGLLTLPWELQEACLRRLAARDLAALSAACAQLHSLAAVDALWRPLLEAEFGADATVADRADANARGWKAAFAALWRRRAARRRAAHRLLHAGPRARPFPPAPVPWAPQRPGGGGPIMPPHVIGGDYDRLPGGLGFDGGVGGMGFGGLPGGGVGGGGVGGGGAFFGPAGFGPPPPRGGMFGGGGGSGFPGGAGGSGIGNGGGGLGPLGFGGGPRRGGGGGGAGWRLY